MLDYVKDLFSPKVGARLTVRGFLSLDARVRFQNAIQCSGLAGTARVTSSYAEIRVEGPKPKVEALINTIQSMPLSSQPLVLEVSWIPFQRQFDALRITV